MSIFGLAKKGFGLLGKKNKIKKPFSVKEATDRAANKTLKKLKKRKRDDAIFKGVMGGGALTGYVGIRLESEMSDRQKYRSPKKNKEKK